MQGEELERLRATRLARIAAERTQPAALANRALPELIYGSASPYGRPFSGNGDEASVKAITEADILLFSAVSTDTNAVHLDEEFASKTEFGQRIVNSLFTLGLMIGITVNDTTLGTTIADAVGYGPTFIAGFLICGVV